MATFTIGSGGDFATITEALALGSVVPGDTLALLSGYNTETASVGIENLTFSGDASNTGIALTLSTGIMAITLIGSSRRRTGGATRFARRLRATASPASPTWKISPARRRAARP